MILRPSNPWRSGLLLTWKIGRILTSSLLLKVNLNVVILVDFMFNSMFVVPIRFVSTMLKSLMVNLILKRRMIVMPQLIMV